MDRRPGLRRTGAWNPADLGLPSAEVLNMAIDGSSFYSLDEGESSSTRFKASVVAQRHLEVAMVICSGGGGLQTAATSS